MWVTKFEFLWWARRPLWQLIFGGVFERFPELRVAFTEQGADWIPAMLDRLDEQYHSPFERGITDKLSFSPPGYWNRNCYVGASFMSRAECDVRDRIGVDRMMWGADYPHIEGTWPHSLDALREAVNGCTPEEVRLMTSETAAGVYGFDLARLQPVADRVGPRLDDLVTPAVPGAGHLLGNRLRPGQGERHGERPPPDGGDVQRRLRRSPMFDLSGRVGSSREPARTSAPASPGCSRRRAPPSP